MNENPFLKKQLFSEFLFLFLIGRSLDTTSDSGGGALASAPLAPAPIALATSTSSPEEAAGPASLSLLPDSDPQSDSDELFDGSSELDPLELDSVAAAPLIAIWYKTQIPPGPALLLTRKFKEG